RSLAGLGDRKAGHVRGHVPVLDPEKLRALGGCGRHAAGNSSPRGRWSRAHAKESSPKNAAFGVLHGPIGLDAVSSRLGIVVGLSIVRQRRRAAKPPVFLI